MMSGRGSSVRIGAAIVALTLVGAGCSAPTVVSAAPEAEAPFIAAFDIDGAQYPTPAPSATTAPVADPEPDAVAFATDDRPSDVEPDIRTDRGSLAPDLDNAPAPDDDEPAVAEATDSIDEERAGRVKPTPPPSTAPDAPAESSPARVAERVVERTEPLAEAEVVEATEAALEIIRSWHTRGLRVTGPLGDTEIRCVLCDD